MQNEILSFQLIMKTKQKYHMYGKTLNNICTSRVCYRESSFSSDWHKMRITQIPILKSLTSQSSTFVKKLINENFSFLEEITDYESQDKYFEVNFVNGNRKYYMCNALFIKMFDSLTFDDSLPYYCIDNPVLQYNEEYKNEINLLSNWIGLKKKNEIKRVIKTFDNNCKLIYNNQEFFSSKYDIIKAFNKLSGFLGINLFKANLFMRLTGTKDNLGKSLLNIHVDFYSHGYLLHFTFNEKQIVNNINITSSDRVYNSKDLYPKAIELIKEGKYDDLADYTINYLSKH